MDIFGIKKRKEEKKRVRLEKEQAEKLEKELQAKINIKKTLSAMKTQSTKLERMKKEYIEKARKATLVGDGQTCALAKTGLKMCLSKQKVVDTMIANFEISMQLNDLNKIIGDFVGGMNTISEQMKDITSSFDMVKAQSAYEKALANNAGQYQALDAFLETATESIQGFDGLDSNISEEEIDSLINNGAVEAENEIDQEIDKKINDIQARLQV
ncbi:MAG: hypothetical protein E7353_02265 [Clostridiales bacterium]|nr:hypothetical protein [Clostridiales bacterium]